MIDAQSPSGRPHLAMLVGNPVIGDSRVEKTAVSAVRAGYRVTIVGVGNAATFRIGHFEQIPIYCIPLPFTRHKARARALRDRNVTGRKSFRPGWVRAAADSLDTVRERFRARRPGGWRVVWPQTVDYEEAFRQVLEDLEPDIIHAHDRHPMAGAAIYSAARREAGAPVPWVYDAHEWVPGTIIAGPPAARIAWVALESELARAADAVIAATDKVAGKLQTRHRLGVRPATVINAPRLARQPLPPDQRRPLREECGLAPGVPLLVYVGMLAEHRGVFTLVEAMTMMPGAHVAIVGSRNDALREQLHDRAVAGGARDRLHLLDYVPSGSVTWYIESATCGISALMPAPAHDLAMPTKLREYAQAGLPVIASNLDTQASFVKTHGVGTLFEPGSPDSLAAAFHRLMANRGGYVRAVQDPDFIAAQTWEGNEPALRSTWHALCPVPALRDTTPAPARRTREEPGHEEPRRPALSVIGARSSDPWVQAWSRHAGDGTGHLGYHATIDQGGPSISDALTSWLEINSSADAVLYQGLVSAHGPVSGGILEEIRSLQGRGKAVGVLTDAPLVDPDLLRQRPGHALSDKDTEVYGRYRRQARRMAQPLLELRDDGIPLFTPSPGAAALLDGVHWVPSPLPHPVRQDDPRVAGKGPVDLLIVPTLRSIAENEQLDRLVAEGTRRGLTVHRPRASAYSPDQAAQADIVVDGLCLGEWTQSAAHAWATGRLVVGHLDDAMAPVLPPTWAAAPPPPIIESTVAGLVDTVLYLAQSLDGQTRVRTHWRGVDFAASTCDGRLSVAKLREAWEL